MIFKKALAPLMLVAASAVPAHMLKHPEASPSYRLLVNSLQVVGDHVTPAKDDEHKTVGEILKSFAVEQPYPEKGARLTVEQVNANYRAKQKQKVAEDAWFAGKVEKVEHDMGVSIPTTLMTSEMVHNYENFFSLDGDFKVEGKPQTYTLRANPEDVADLDQDEMDVALAHELRHAIKHLNGDKRENRPRWSERDADLNGSVKTYGIDRTTRLLERIAILYPDTNNPKTADYHGTMTYRENYVRSSIGRTREVFLSSHYPFVEIVPVEQAKSVIARTPTSKVLPAP